MSDSNAPQLLAVVRTDIVDSTPYQLRVGDDVAVPSLASHLGQLNAITAAHGGDVVNRQGDGLCAVFPSVSAAIRAAQEIQSSNHRRSNWSDHGRFALRIGVAAGEMVMTGLEAAGRPMIEAERLQSAAETGQILCSASAAAMTGGRLDDDLEPAGERHLKGYTDPVEVLSVAWSSLANPLAVLTPALEREPPTRFVGRADEKERLEQLWQRATRGEPRFVFIEGEAGVGKSRLARELTVSAHERGAATLYAPCYHDDEQPYSSLIRGLQHYLPRLRGQSYLLGPYAADLAPLVPEITDYFPDLVLSQPEDVSSGERSAVQRAVHGWLTTATADEPMLVVVEDIQWADERTLSVLTKLVNSIDHERLMIVATARPLVEVDSSGPLRDVQRHDLSTPIRLYGLDRPDTVALVSAIAGHSLDEEPETTFAERVWRQTDGNPFFVQALLRSLAARGALKLVDGRWTSSGDLADVVSRSEIRETVRGQLVGVDDEGLELLRIAAVLGSEFTLSMLHRVADHLAIGDLNAVDKAIRAQMLVELPGQLDTYRFSHEIVRSTFEGEVNPEVRARIHELAARVTIDNAGSADAADPVALSWHLGQSLDPATRGEAASYAATAGQKASRAGAWEQASALYLRALRIIDSPDVIVGDQARAEALLGAGLAAYNSGDPSGRDWLRQAMDAAEELKDGTLMARAALVRNRGMFSSLGGVDYELVDGLERALALMDNRPSALRSVALAALGAELTWAGDRDHQESILADAEEMARALEDPTTPETVENLCKVLVLKGNSIWRPSTLSERLELSNDLETKTMGLGIPGWRFAAASLEFQASMEAGLFARADLRLARMERLADRLNEPIVQWFANLRRTVRLATSGRFDEAKAAAEEALKIGVDAWDPDEAQLYYFGNQWMINYHLGQLGLLEEVFSMSADLPNTRPVLRPALAAIYAETGEPDSCSALLEQIDESSFVDDHDLLVTAAVTAIAARAVGDETRASLAYETLAPYEGQMIDNASTHFGDVDHYLALAAATMGDRAEALDRLKKATERHRRLGADPLTARSRVETERVRAESLSDNEADHARAALNQLAIECAKRGFDGAANAARSAVAG